MNKNKSPLVINFNDANENKTKDIRSKIQQAKIHGNEEIEILKEALNSFSTTVESLVLSNDFSKEVINVHNDYIDNYLFPILKGHKPMSVEEDSFNDARKEIFNSLISKYID